MKVWKVWFWPVVLGLLTASGLVTALLSDGAGDWWAWIALGIPTAVMVWYGCLRRERPSK